MSDAPNDRDRDPSARALPAEIVGLPTQLHAIGAAMTEIRMELGSLRTVDDRLDRMEELITAIGHQLDEAPAADDHDRAAAVEQRLARIEATVDGLAASAGAAPAFDPGELAVDLLTGTEAAVTRALTGLAISMREDQDARLEGLADAIADAVVAGARRRNGDGGGDEVDAAVARATAATTELAHRLEGALDDLAGHIAADVVTAISEPFRQVAVDAATQAGVAVAEGSIAAAEVASETILAEQDVKLAQLAQMIARIQETLTGAGEHGHVAQLADMVSRVQEAAAARAEETQSTVEGLTGLLERLARQVDDLGRSGAAGGAVIPALREMEASIRASVETLHARADQDNDDLEAGISAGVVAASRDALESTGQMIVSSALASFERAAMTTQSDLERATEAALDTLLAAVDARLTGVVLGAGDALAESVRDVIADAQAGLAGGGADPMEVARTASHAAVTAALTYATDAVPETAMSVAEHVAVHLEAATADAIHAAVRDAVEGSIAPVLRSAGQAIVVAVTDAVNDVADVASEPAGRGAVDTEAIVAATSESVNEGLSALEDMIRDAMAVRSVQAVRPPEGQEITSAMMSAVAESLNDFSAGVQAHLDAMSTRLTSLATVLEALVEETAARRRGPRTGTLDLLRQVAAEAPPAPKPRKRPAGRSRTAKAADAEHTG